MDGRPASRGLRGILFDKDGTLVDYALTWGPLNLAAARLAARGDDVLAARLLELGGVDPVSGVTAPGSLLAAHSNREIADAWVAAGSPFDAASLTADLDRLFTGGAEAAVPVTDLAVLFARLKARGLALGIASSDSEAGIHALVARFGLGGFVDFVAGYDSGHGVKPGPGMLLGFLAATGLEAAEVAVVGDNDHDMAMASGGGAGLRVAVLTGTGTREILEPVCDVCLASVTEIETVVFGANAGA